MRRLTGAAGTEPAPIAVARPRLAFVGLGWIGLDRMRAAADSGLCEIAVVADPDPACRDRALAAAPGAAAAATLEEALAARPDGVVIATPNALHARQAIAALDAGAAVFCQKPLGLDAAEAEAVVAAARRADRRLGVDMSYRHTAALRALRESVTSGALGTVFAADLMFHNAYGPDKAWYRDPARAGGGALIDLGVHLVDLALWLLDGPEIARVEAALYRRGGPVPAGAAEDFAAATLTTEAGAQVRLACSWWTHAGADAVIGVALHGSRGGARMGNVAGSFYDFEAHRHAGTARERIAAPPDAWGGRALVDWIGRLAAAPRFDPACAEQVALARVIDRIYAAGRAPGQGCGAAV